MFLLLVPDRSNVIVLEPEWDQNIYIQVKLRSKYVTNELNLGSYREFRNSERQFSWGPCRRAVPQAGSVRGNFPGARAAGRCAVGWLREKQFSWGPCRRAVPQAGSVRGTFSGARAAGLCRRLAA